MKKGFFSVFALVLLVVAAFVVVNMTNDPVTTELARYGYLENAVEVDGLVVRTEQVMTTDSGGVFESTFAEGQRVSNGQKIGTVYKGEVSPAVASELNSINTKLSQLSAQDGAQKLAFDDVYKIDSQISARIDDIVGYAIDGNGRSIESAKQEMDQLQDNKLVIQGKKEQEQDEKTVLTSRKTELEAGLQKSDIFAAMAGVFSYTIDGLEDKVGVSSLASLTPKALDGLLKSDTNKDNGVFPGNPVAKVIDNFLWYYSFNLTQVQLDNLKVGDGVYLRFTAGTEELIPAVIETISPQEEGRVCVSVSCTHEVPSMTSNRKLKGTLIKRRYEGYKFPREAIRIKDNVTGVYIVSGGAPAFRPVEVLYSNDNFAVISSEQSAANQVKLYDEIIVKAGEIEEGKLLR